MCKFLTPDYYFAFARASPHLRPRLFELAASETNVPLPFRVKPRRSLPRRHHDVHGLLHEPSGYGPNVRFQRHLKPGMYQSHPME